MTEEMVPIFRVEDALKTAKWYARLGFQIVGEHRFTPELPLYLFLERGEVHLHLSEHKGDATPDTLVYFWVDNVDSIATEFNVSVSKQPWAREIEVVTQFDENLSMVEAPGRDVNQVWTNLIDNADDAMESEGTLTISAINRDDSVVVSVADTGSGMDHETAERIFDPFFTTKEPGKGTGLGLHTVHTIITRVGGEITVASDTYGTTFTVILPTTPEEVPAGPR